MLAFVNGLETDLVSLQNRGLQYGDGVFETCRVNQQGIEFVEWHLDRLLLALQRLFFNQPDQLMQTIKHRIDCALQVASSNHDVLKLIVCRRSRLRGYSPKNSQVDIIVQLFESTKTGQKQSYSVGLCDTPISVNRQIAGLKHLNRLDCVLAKAEVEAKNWDEGWLCCDQGWIHDGVMSNLFYQLNGQWFTPPIDRAGVTGVQRQLILKRAMQSQQPIVERALHKDELLQISAAFMSNRLIKMVPVSHLANRALNDCNEFINQLLNLLGECK